MLFTGPPIPYILNTHLRQAGVAADGLVAGVLAVLVAVTHPAQGDAGRCKLFIYLQYSFIYLLI